MWGAGFKPVVVGIRRGSIPPSGRSFFCLPLQCLKCTAVLKVHYVPFCIRKPENLKMSLLALALPFQILGSRPSVWISASVIGGVRHRRSRLRDLHGAGGRSLAQKLASSPALCPPAPARPGGAREEIARARMPYWWVIT